MLRRGISGGTSRSGWVFAVVSSKEFTDMTVGGRTIASVVLPFLNASGTVQAKVLPLTVAILNIVFALEPDKAVPAHAMFKVIRVCNIQVSCVGRVTKSFIVLDAMTADTVRSTVQDAFTFFNGVDTGLEIVGVRISTLAVIGIGGNLISHLEFARKTTKVFVAVAA
jgi:hypothetical protein